MQFYNSTIQKLVYPDSRYIWDEASADTALIPGMEYICITQDSNPLRILRCKQPRTMMFEIKKVVEASVFDHSFYCAVHINSYEQGREYPPNTDRIIVGGYFLNAYPGAVYSAVGYWGEGKDGSSIFFLTEYEQLLSSSASNVRKYLKYAFKGHNIGGKFIDAMIDYMGVDALHPQTDEVQFIRAVPSAAKRNAIIDALDEMRDKEQAFEFLVQTGILAEAALTAISGLGMNCYARIKNNPYLLLRFDTIPITKVNALARVCGVPYNCLDNVSGLIIRYINYRRDSFGDVYIEKDILMPAENSRSIFEQFYLVDKRCSRFQASFIDMAIDSLTESGLLVKEQDMQTGHFLLYTKAYYDMEVSIAAKMKAMVRKPPTFTVDDADLQRMFDSYERDGITLDEGQKQAVRMALSNRVSIISGGPGTGKTMITKLIVDLFRSNNPDKKIQLCAPTGKASFRMSEVIGMEACTIHRKLGYGSGFDRTIEEDLLVMDECSMIDIELFDKILKALSANTSLIMIGDYNQLPSVGPGLVLRDLVDSHVIPTTMLTSVFRQKNGSKIIDAAHAVLKQDITGLNTIPGSDFVFLECQSNQAVYNHIRTYASYLIQEKHVDPDDVQIITPQNDGMLGTVGLNSMMRSICNPDASAASITVGGEVFHEGDRIIQTVNDSDIDVYNGTIGHIVRIGDTTIAAEFNGRQVSLTKKNLATMKLGYAITVHRSQGSEFAYVLMPVISDHVTSLNMNLLYTGITRSRRACLLIGNRSAVLSGLQREEVAVRRSKLKSRLLEADS